LKERMVAAKFQIGVYILVLLQFACTPDSTRNASPKFQQYFVQGQQLYKIHCSNCHQLNGKGLGRLYPPLDNSDFMDRQFEEVLCVIKYGKKGSIEVNGVEYNMEMKGNPGLTDLEVAEIATFIFNNWSLKRGLIDVQEVSQRLSDCKR